MKIFLILFLSILTAGCTLDFALPENEPMQLSIYQSGRPVYARELTSKDPVAQIITRWLAANPDGWEYAFTTRAPHIYLKGKNFSVNILENEVSVKYCRASFYNCHFWTKMNSGLFLEVQKITSTSR